MKNYELTEVLIIEVKGGGQKIDEVKKFATTEEADKFIRAYNSYDSRFKPCLGTTFSDWYMYAKLK